MNIIMVFMYHDRSGISQATKYTPESTRFEIHVEV